MSLFEIFHKLKKCKNPNIFILILGRNMMTLTAFVKFVLPCLHII